MGASAALVPATRACGVHQDPAHHLRRHRKKLCALAPIDFGHVYQAEVHFVDQGRCLQSVGLVFILHIPAGDSAQFRIDLPGESRQRSLVAAAPSS